MSKNKKNIKSIPVKIFIFTTKTIFCTLHGRVFIMAGQKASAILLEGALQVYSTVPGTREYMKFGNVRSALKDFYNTNPDDVMFTKLKNGVSIVPFCKHVVAKVMLVTC